MHTYVLGAASPTDPRVRDTAMVSQIKMPKTVESSYFTAREAAVAASGASATQMDFDQAEAAGIDAFELLVGPFMLPKSAFSDGLNLLASVAQQQRIKIIPDIWADPWASDYKVYGQRVKQYMDAHPGAFLLHNGKPMFVFFFVNLEKHFSEADTGGVTAKVQDFLQPWGGPDKTYTMMYLSSYDAKLAASAPVLAKANALGVWSAQDDWSALHSQVVLDVAKLLHKEVAWPVSPNFYQRRAAGSPMEYGNGLGAARYIDAWLKAVDIDPAFVDIQTWNDFSEDTSIRPTNATGDSLRDLTKFFVEWVQRGSQPPIANEHVMLFHPEQLSNASLADPSAKTINASWRHLTPTIDYLDCVTLLKQEADVTMVLGNAHWQQRIPAGFHEWLIYVPQQAPPARKGEVVAGNGSYPTPSSFRFVTTAQPFSEGTPEIVVKRSGNVILTIKSRAPYSAHGDFQDLTLIGDEGPK